MDDLPRLNKGLFTDVTHGAFVRSWTKRATALKNGRRVLQVKLMLLAERGCMHARTLKKTSSSATALQAQSSDSARVLSQGEQAWQKCKEGKNWSLLFGVLISSYFWYIVGSVLLHLVSTGAGFAFPILLEYITNYLELCGAEAVRSPAALSGASPNAAELSSLQDNRT